MQKQLILFYSDKCNFCNELIQIIYKNQDLYQSIIKVDILEKNINIPPYIKSVPTMLLNIDNKKSILTGNNLFEWIESQNKQSSENNMIEDWDPKVMSGSSYSDSFSYLDNNEATIKNFSFINSGFQEINCPKEDSDLSNNNSSNKPGVNKDYERLMQQRQLDEPKQINRI